MSIGIYKIENLINGKIYIGQSIHIEKRWSEHCQPSANSLIAQAIRKYGKENFSFQIMKETSDITELNALETEYIRQYNSLAPHGYNITLVDSNEHHQFNKYDYEVFLQIINDIKCSNLSFKEIAELYQIDLSMVYYLNRGDYHTLAHEQYPLRPLQKQSVQSYCIDCGCKISKDAVRCSKCDHLQQRRAVRPSRNELKQLIRTKSFTAIGRQYGVTDNTIRKWCQSEALPSKAKEIKAYSDLDWEKI